jgi:small-conductance mechanosensitive channel
MADPASTRVEPNIGPTPVSSTLATDELRAAVEPAASQSRPAAGSGSANDQLSRIEDKTARIEEKYARSEAILQRVGSTVETATSRMNEVASQAELAALRDQVRRLPGKGALFAVAILTPLLTAAIVYVLLRYGLPGPGAMPR